MPQEQLVMGLLQPAHVKALSEMVNTYARGLYKSYGDEEEAVEAARALFGHSVDEILSARFFVPNLEFDCRVVFNQLFEKFGDSFITIGKNEHQYRKAALCTLVAAKCWLQDRPRPSAYENVMWWENSQVMVEHQFRSLLEHGHDATAVRTELVGLIDKAMDELM